MQLGSRSAEPHVLRYGAVPGDGVAEDDEAIEERTKRFTLGAVTISFVFLISGVAALGASTSTESQTLRAAELDSSSAAVVVAAASSDKTIQVWNSYGGQPTSFDEGIYSFGAEQIVEPYRTTTLSVGDSTGADDWTWTVKNVDTGKSKTLDTTGSSVREVFKSRGGELFEVTATSSKLSDTRTLSARSKFVRRELRSLSNEDANDYLEALQHVYTTTQEDGHAAYGDEFTSYDWFQRWHLGSRSLLSPFHSNPAFFTSHAYLGSKMERSLQSIKPKVALHYWDFTIDSEMDHWEESSLWSKNWFGPASDSSTDDTLKRVEGRFRDISLMRNVSFDLDAKRWHGHTVNSYGLVTSPWNNNPATYLTRSFSVCGLSTTTMKLPGCAELLPAFTKTDMADFHAIVEYTVHLQFHLMLGGMWECQVDLLKDLQHPDQEKYITTLATLSLDIVNTINPLFYKHNVYTCPEYCSLETAFEDCACIDLELTKILNNPEPNTTQIDDLFHARVVEQMGPSTIHLNNAIEVDDDGKSTFTGFSEKESMDLKVLFLNMIRIPPKVSQFATPLASHDDPLFWPLHVNWDRIWAYMRLAKDFDSEWSYDAVEAYKQLGWGYDDPLAPCDDAYGNQKDDGKYFTNRELVELFAPDKVDLPYVYSDFAFQGCEQK
jgi:hypothetical protein